MREISLFLDESGDFGPYSPHSPYYVIGMVVHDQSDDITVHLDRIHQALVNRGFPASHAIHTGPLIRREQDYSWMSIEDRRSLFRVLFDFVRHTKVQVCSWTFDKRQLGDSDAMVAAMAQALGGFIRDHLAFFQGQDRIVIYYDNGQKEITNLVNTVFNTLLTNVTIRRVVPSAYSLFQAADLCCTLELLRVKLDRKSLSKSELSFFATSTASAERALRKNYLRKLDHIRFQ